MKKYLRGSGKSVEKHCSFQVHEGFFLRKTETTYHMTTIP